MQSLQNKKEINKKDLSKVVGGHYPEQEMDNMGGGLVLPSLNTGLFNRVLDAIRGN